MTAQKETIADKVKECWPGFKLFEDESVEQLRHWIKAEIVQLNDALEILEDDSIVGPDGKRKLSDPAFAPHEE